MLADGMPPNNGLNLTRDLVSLDPRRLSLARYADFDVGDGTRVRRKHHRGWWSSIRRCFAKP